MKKTVNSSSTGKLNGNRASREVKIVVFAMFIFVIDFCVKENINMIKVVVRSVLQVILLTWKEVMVKKAMNQCCCLLL